MSTNAQNDKVTIERANRAIHLATISLIGKTIIHAAWDSSGEGTFKLEFSDGSGAEFTSSGDDATHTILNLIKK